MAGEASNSPVWSLSAPSPSPDSGRGERLPSRGIFSLQLSLGHHPYSFRIPAHSSSEALVMAAGAGPPAVGVRCSQAPRYPTPQLAALPKTCRSWHIITNRLNFHSSQHLHLLLMSRNISAEPSIKTLFRDSGFLWDNRASDGSHWPALRRVLCAATDDGQGSDCRVSNESCSGGIA